MVLSIFRQLSSSQVIASSVVVFRTHKTPRRERRFLLQMTVKEAPRILHSGSSGNQQPESKAPVFRRPQQTVPSHPRGITDGRGCFPSQRLRLVGSRRRRLESRWVWTTRSGWTRHRSASHPGHVERGRRPVIRGADTRVEMAATTPIRDKSQQPGDSLDFSHCLSMKLSTFLSRANAVPGQEVLAAGWQTGTFCSASWGRIATAKRLGAGVRNVKEGGALTVLVGLAAKFLLAASPPRLVTHTVTQPTRHGREGRERRTQP